jgi:hypothetical protein
MASRSFTIQTGVGPRGPQGPAGEGSGVDTFAELTDKASADIASINESVANALGLLAPKASPTFTGTVTTSVLTVNGAATFNDSIDFNDGTIVGMTAAAKTDWKSTLDISNVDNTSDATKNSATATLTNKTIDAADNTLSGTASSLVTGGSVIGLITESTTARTLSATDIHKKVRYTNASGCAITIPNGIGVSGTYIIGRRATGAGELSFSLGGSVTVNNSGIASITAGQEFALMALSANEYDFV